MLTKSKAAFQLSAESLWQKGFRVYFWTFTFSVVHSDWECTERFRAFLNHLRVVLDGDWGGVRVAELHKTHGVHYHALINRRLAVDIVRRVGRCHGIGRIFVCVADGKSCAYLSKYLSKGVAGPVGPKGRSARRWSSFGKVPHRCRVSDLVNDSPMWVYRRAHSMPFVRYGIERRLDLCWLRGERCFARAWHAANDGDDGLVWNLSCGREVVVESGMLVQSMVQSGMVGPF